MSPIEITQASLPDLAKRGAQKYDHGHTLVISGGPGKTGAARLAGRAALRVGSGLVTIACPQRAIFEVGAHVTSIMISALDGPSGLRELLEDHRLNAICIGPGLGLGHITADLTRAALESGRSVVLDADALSRFQPAPEALFAMMHEKVVLTPHGGEFARLFPDLAERMKQDGSLDAKLDATRQAAARAGATVLFKGEDTVVASAAGEVAVHHARGERAVPWLATAGAGDVLAGLIAGLLARGYAPFDAAKAACWLHVECARVSGPGGIAEDLPDCLPKVFAQLGL